MDNRAAIYRRGKRKQMLNRATKCTKLWRPMIAYVLKTRSK